MSFDEVLNAIGDAKGHLITAEDAANAFGHFDNGAGHMSVKELKSVLLKLGEPLSNDVVGSRGRGTLNQGD